MSTRQLSIEHVPSELRRLCQLAGVSRVLGLGGMPNRESDIRERVRQAVDAEQRGAPMPAVPTGGSNFEFSVRHWILKPAQARVRFIDQEIERFRMEREELEALLQPGAWDGGMAARCWRALQKVLDVRP